MTRGKYVPWSADSLLLLKALHDQGKKSPEIAVILGMGQRRVRDRLIYDSIIIPHPLTRTPRSRRPTNKKPARLKCLGPCGQMFKSSHRVNNRLCEACTLFCADAA